MRRTHCIMTAAAMDWQSRRTKNIRHSAPHGARRGEKPERGAVPQSAVTVGGWKLNLAEWAQARLQE
jgi:hypothetical protein